MASSLASQLSKGISLNAPLLADRSRRKRAESYLFTSREAERHDLHSIYALGVTGLSKLKTLDAKFAQYDDSLFSDGSRDFDRTLQSVSENAKLDRTLGSFLRDLGPYLLEAPTSRALEWLVRRFRVNEFNLDDVMALFLPYHDTPHFAKMMSIMHVGESRVWSFLSPTKAAGKPLPRSILVEEMLKNVDLARFVIGLLSESLDAGREYRTLIGFTAGATVDYLTRMKTVEENIIAFVLPAAIRYLATDSNVDCALAGYLILATLSRRCRLSSDALSAIMAGMMKGQRHIESQQFLPLLIAVIGPQDEQDQFSDSFVDSIMQLPGVTDALSVCLQWAGVEKLMFPLLPRLVRRASEKPCFDLLDSILSSSNTSGSIVERHTLLCMEAMLHSADRSNPALLQLLSATSQRHGDAFSHAYAERLKAETDMENRLAFESILRSLELPSFSSVGNRGKWVLSSQAADVNSRIMSVKEILNELDAGDTGEDLYEALRNRAMDTNATVIETLYSKPQTVIPVLSNLPFIESVSNALATPGITRPTMRLHFTFIAEKLCGHDADLTPAIFERIYLPYILFTKPRQKTATLVWKALRHSRLANYELLAGCMDIVFPQSEAEEASRSMEEMATLNLAVTAKIAGNIVISNAYHIHFDKLLSLLGSSDAHTTITVYLIFRSLLNQLSGEHQVNAANRILTAMGLRSLDMLHEVMEDTANLQDAISDDSLSKNVVLKPSSAGTLRRLQAAVLALIPIIQRPVGVKIDWLGNGCSGSSDTRGKHFVELARAVYTIANSSSAAQSLSTRILRALFVNLREDALQFLAGIWATGVQSDANLNNLCLAALSHGAAFLKARLADIEHPQDFQVILPSLLIAMQSEQPSVREAAMDCICIIEQSSTSTTASPTIYALDSVYGISSDGLQYLEQSDFGRYVSSLHLRRQHFINDGHYLGVFQQEMLCKEPGESKKDSGYKYRILCYTLSHVLVWSSLEARLMLLNTMKNVSNPAKLEMLLPLIQQLIPGNSATPRDKEERSVMWDKYCQALLEAFDSTTATDLNETGSGSWTTLMRLLRFMFSTGAPPSIRDTILRQLRTGLFDMLTVEHQLEISIVLVDAAAVQTEHHPLIKETLCVLLNNITLITSLLAHFQPSETDNSQRATKRAKMVASTEQSLRPLTVLVEILIAITLPGSVELMSCAIDVLNGVFHTHSSKPDANYLMQLLMSMLESLASSLDGTAVLSPGSVRMEILVELLRVSENPQTFNQALLLIASLARLSPEFVMQNVMPVFTFMGSNVFHRDDSYSFRVVQKTVESIVPVMIRSLKDKYSAPLELQIASRVFLRVFTDASTHVPRHRRTQFFNHLVEVLGPEEFTVPICLLLVDKVSNRVVRQKPGDALNALSLPLAILQANFKATPFKILEQLLHETSLLLIRIIKPEVDANDAFLKSHVDGEQTSPTTAKRQIQAILMFVDIVLQQFSRRGSTSDADAVRESVRILLELADLDRQSTSSQDFSDISQISLKTLAHLLRGISVAEFASSIATIIATRNPAIESGAMNLLSSRLVNVAPKTRREISPTIISITEHICDSLKESHDLPTIKAELMALAAIAKTAVDSETAGLTKAFPCILQVVAHQKSITAEVLACILPLSGAIGPRILPFFRGVVELCCDVLTQIDTAVDGPHSRTAEDAQSVLVALLSSLSQFWGIDELVRLIGLSLSDRPVPLLRKTLAKRMPAKQLLPALFRVWPDVAATADDERSSSQEAFFDLFKRVVRRSPREDVHEHLRQTFKLFLEAFDIAGENKDASSFENALLTAFVEVVTKLNEAAFKPLYRRLCDWAFDEAIEASPYRQIILCRVLTALIKLLKGLITPYMSIVLAPLTETLDSYRANDRRLPPRLWHSAVELFQTSIDLDEGAFWRSDNLRKLVPTLVAQIDVCPALTGAGGGGSARQALKTCLNALAGAADDGDDDALLKMLNLAVLMKTRADDAQVRLLALECAVYMWQESGDKLSGFVSDVVTFIAECADDEHDEVAKEARRLKKTLESRCGSLDVFAR